MANTEYEIKTQNAFFWEGADFKMELYGVFKSVVLALFISFLITVLSFKIPFLLGGDSETIGSSFSYDLPPEIQKLYQKEMLDESDMRVFDEWIENNKKVDRGEKLDKSKFSKKIRPKVYLLTSAIWIFAILILNFNYYSGIAFLVSPILFYFEGEFLFIEILIIVFAVLVKLLYQKYNPWSQGKIDG